MGKSTRRIKGKDVREHDLETMTPAERAVHKAFVNDRTATKRELRGVAVSMRGAR